MQELPHHYTVEASAEAEAAWSEYYGEGGEGAETPAAEAAPVADDTGTEEAPAE